MTPLQTDPSSLTRFFRSGLFPLIVVVLLVYLASQTLMGASDETTKVAYSDLVVRVQTNPRSVRKVLFVPNRREIRAELITGGRLETTYPTPASQVTFERLLGARGIAYDFDWSETRKSAWWSLFTALLPFVLLFGFWIFLTNRRERSKRA